MDEQHPNACEAVMTELMMPHHANVLGHVFGGVILSLVDRAAAVAAIRHARGPCGPTAHHPQGSGKGEGLACGEPTGRCHPESPCNGCNAERDQYGCGFLKSLSDLFDCLHFISLVCTEPISFSPNLSYNFDTRLGSPIPEATDIVITDAPIDFDQSMNAFNSLIPLPSVE